MLFRDLHHVDDRMKLRVGSKLHRILQMIFNSTWNSQHPHIINVMRKEISQPFPSSSPVGWDTSVFGKYFLDNISNISILLLNSSSMRVFKRESRILRMWNPNANQNQNLKHCRKFKNEKFDISEISILRRIVHRFLKNLVTQMYQLKLQEKTKRFRPNWLIFSWKFTGNI